MDILFLDWPCFGGIDAQLEFQKRGYNVINFFHEDYLKRDSDSFCKYMKQFDDHDFSFCFSYNYYPLVAKYCFNRRLKYISFVYDSPQVKLFSFTITYPTNYVFVFDSYTVDFFRKQGINTFYYMPLPVNAEVINTLLQNPYDKQRLSADISFVGSLYNEEHNFMERLTNISDYTRGYLDAIMKSQLKVSGLNFIEQCLTPDIIDDIQKNLKYSGTPDGVEPLSYIISDYYIARKLTSTERTTLISAIAQKHRIKVFSFKDSICHPNAEFMGTADYYDEMPYIFHNSRINLNISLRSIRTGIPLRCMDIMANKGFLLTNYQADLFRHFTPDEDFVYFEDEADLLRKIDYYLSHEDERLAIAEHGYNTMRNTITFKTVFDEILRIAAI